MIKILKSLVTIVAVAAIATGATGAYFSSSVDSPGNTFATGTMNINVNGQAPTATAVFNASDLAPGNVIPGQAFVVNNTGSLSGNHLDLEVTLSGDTALAQYIVFTGNGSNSLRFGSDQTGPNSVRFDYPNYTAGDASYDIKTGLAPVDYLYGPLHNPDEPAGAGGGMDRDLDGRVTLADLAVGKIRIIPRDVSAGIAASSTATLWMNAKVDSAMDDSMQGKSVSATFAWTLHQDASQY
jgi:predicted ribosomally synthesized peptide with SipW-like signal peptide